MGTDICVDMPILQIRSKFVKKYCVIYITDEILKKKKLYTFWQKKSWRKQISTLKKVRFVYFKASSIQFLVLVRVHVFEYFNIERDRRVNLAHL